MNAKLNFLARLRIMNICAFVLVLLWAGADVHAQAAAKVSPPDSRSGKPVATPAPAVSVAPPQPFTPPSYLSSLEYSNGFDPERKLWPDKVPPPPPPPLPPPPPPITDQDLQLYGVVIVGETKRATVKVGSRFSTLITTGRSFVTLSEGQTLGEFVLAEIQPTHLVLSAPGVKQTVTFSKKTDRVASTSPQPVQVNATPGSDPAPTNTASPPTTGLAPDTNPAASTATRAASDAVPGNTAMGATPKQVPVATENVTRNAPPGSLAAAIGAAQAAAQNAPQPSQNTPPPANFNPFLSLFPKQ